MKPDYPELSLIMSSAKSKFDNLGPTKHFSDKWDKRVQKLHENILLETVVTNW
jgi:hypothetical protein